MAFQASAAMRACSGAIMINSELVSGNVAMASGAQVASWSVAGSPVGQERSTWRKPASVETGLNLYIYDRAGDSSGAAGKVDSFRVGP